MPWKKTINSVKRAMDLLEFVTVHPKGMRLSTIAACMGLSKTATYKIVSTLSEQGFLERYGSPARYRLTALMEGLRKRQDLWNRTIVLPAMPLITAMAKGTGGDVMVSQYIGGIVTGRLFAAAADRASLSYWHRCPVALYGTAVLFQAYLAPSERNLFRARHPWSESDRVYWKSFALLDRFLPIARRAGYMAFAKASVFRSAAAVLDPEGKMEALVSVTRPLADLRPGEARACLNATRRMARAISDRLRSVAETAQCDAGG